ncbi:MAG TPA: hypothetical protein VHC19_12930 [Pirellulales bacterium]|nr:hypothetical protein [Pirellulales bacterium]
MRVYPENLIIHFGNDATADATYNHSRFLQACVFPLGEDTQGLVVKQAGVDVAAAMRPG